MSIEEQIMQEIVVLMKDVSVTKALQIQTQSTVDKMDARLEKFMERQEELREKQDALQKEEKEKLEREFEIRDAAHQRVKKRTNLLTIAVIVIGVIVVILVGNSFESAPELIQRIISLLPGV
jgi:hypothetical protein